MFIRIRTVNKRYRVSIVENARVDGKHVQRTIAYLGSAAISTCRTAEVRRAFWRKARPLLKRACKDQPDDVAEALRKAIDEKIPRRVRPYNYERPVPPIRYRAVEPPNWMELASSYRVWQLFGFGKSAIEHVKAILPHLTAEERAELLVLLSEPDVRSEAA